MATYKTFHVTDEWANIAPTVGTGITIQAWGAAGDEIKPVLFVKGQTSATPPTDDLGAIQLTGASYLSDDIANIWRGVAVTDIYARAIVPGTTATITVIAD